MSLSGTPDTPMKIGPSVVDAFSGLTLAFAISGALLYRERTGEGQFIDVSMLGCAMNLLESNLIDYSITKVNPIRTGNKDNLISPFGVYKAKDGYIVIAIGNNSLWLKFLTFLKENTDVEDDSLFSSNSLRLANNDSLSSIIEKAISNFSVKDLEAKLSQIDIPCSKVNNMSDVYADEDNYKNEFLVKFHHSLLGECVVPGKSIKFSKIQTENLKQAPDIGENDKDYGL